MNRYYWDSCTFISRLQGDPGRIDILEHITDEGSAGRVQLITSTLTLAEVCYIRRECTEEELQHDIDEISRFFDNDFIYLVQVNRAIGADAAQIARLHGVKPPDAIHLSTAIRADCQIVHTYDDKRLLKLDGKVGIPPLSIVKPKGEVQLGLFDRQKIASSAETESRPQFDWKKFSLLTRRLKNKFLDEEMLSFPSARHWGHQQPQTWR